MRRFNFCPLKRLSLFFRCVLAVVLLLTATLAADAGFRQRRQARRVARCAAYEARHEAKANFAAGNGCNGYEARSLPTYQIVEQSAPMAAGSGCQGYSAGLSNPVVYMAPQTYQAMPREPVVCIDGKCYPQSTVRNAIASMSAAKETTKPKADSTETK